MTTPAAPARLNIILARDAPVAVILRRGTSKWVQLIKWNTDTDTFEPGQWFHGRVFEDDCDISPDGQLFVYFARKINPATLNDSEVGYSWTAISKPPYLTALILWPVGHSWGGGGAFYSATCLWLNHWVGAKQKGVLPNTLKVEIRGDYYDYHNFRLRRDGWQCVYGWDGESLHGDFEKVFRQRIKAGLPTDDFDWQMSLLGLPSGSRYGTLAPATWEKPNHTRSATLVRTKQARSYEKVKSYSLRNADGQEQIIADAVWSDWDRQGRLVFAKQGKLFACDDDSLTNSRELADFNAAKPEPLEAPEWAKVW